MLVVVVRLLLVVVGIVAHLADTKFRQRRGERQRNDGGAAGRSARVDQSFYVVMCVRKV